MATLPRGGRLRMRRTDALTHTLTLLAERGLTPPPCVRLTYSDVGTAESALRRGQSVVFVDAP